jgi:hypothetical protein
MSPRCRCLGASHGPSCPLLDYDPDPVSALSDLRDIAPRPQLRPAGPIPRPAELTPVRRPEKGPRTPLNRVGPKRAEKRSRQFGEQAERCSKPTTPCACCGIKGFSVPHHWPTRANGGLDEDTMPLCDGFGSNFCHDAFHNAGSPEAFKESHGCDVLAAIQAMRKKPDHDCERFALLRENGTPGQERSEYVCTRCNKVVPQEQEDESA